MRPLPANCRVTVMHRRDAIPHGHVVTGARPVPAEKSARDDWGRNEQTVAAYGIIPDTATGASRFVSLWKRDCGISLRTIPHIGSKICEV